MQAFAVALMRRTPVTSLNNKPWLSMRVIALGAFFRKPKLQSSGLVVVVAFLAALTLHTTVDADTLKKVASSQKFVIGYRATSVPFSFKDANGAAKGYQVELCARIAERVRTTLKLAKLSVEYREVSSQQRIASIKNGEIDIECASTTITSDRLKEVDFSFATYVTGIRFAVKRSAKIATIAELKDKTVAVGKGTTAERLLKSGETTYRFKRIVSAASSPEAFKLLESGEADAAFTDEPLLLTYIARSKTPDAYEVAGKYLSVEPYGLMLRRDDNAFKSLVNAALSSLFASGEAKTLHEQWFARGEVPMPMNRLTKETFQYPSTHPAFP
jgi:glutamate/aspartate transport system substrate-binding protein